MARIINKWFFLALITISMPLLATVASGAESAGEGTQEEKRAIAVINVTAQKRSEAEQAVPISMERV